jgi:glycosyltransferase involved in cell wall biosynthesis
MGVLEADIKDNMRIKIQQFLFGQGAHSWALVGKNIGRALIHLGHEVDFVSTDGFEDKFCPNDLKPFVKKDPVGEYDCQISYTAPHNWPNYLSYGKKNRFAIWNYEYNNKKVDQGYTALLQGFGKYYKNTDMVLPSSNFTKEVFKSMMIPEDKMVVIPHGIDLEQFSTTKKFPLKTKKSKKILLNIAQPHRRKAIPLALEAFGKAFTKDDDVCLVAKVFKQNNKGQAFDVDFTGMYKTFETKYPKHAEVEFVHNYIDNIAEIYNSCDVNFSATYAECWHLPSLEALACGLINVVPRYGGQLDFCDDFNSLLIDGNVVRAPRDHQYWKFNPFAVHFQIDTNDAAQKLRWAVHPEEGKVLKEKFVSSMSETAQKFSWENAVRKILDLCT